MKVLIVDDSEFIRKTLANIISNFFPELEIYQACSGTEAINKVNVIKPDFIFLDLIMPDINGFDTCKKIRKDYKNEIFIFIITSDEKQETVEKSFDSGANDFILKPFRTQEIYSRLKTYMQLKEYINILEDLNKRDSLTGLFNRSYFNNVINEIDEEYSLILYDIDNFKRVNDRFGHLAGDNAIKEFSKILREYESKIIVPFRYGGEEFGILIKKYDKEKAFIIADEIRKKISSKNISFENELFKITVSGGVSEYNESINKIQSINLTDYRLYLSKNSGKNTITKEGLMNEL